MTRKINLADVGTILQQSDIPYLALVISDNHLWIIDRDKIDPVLNLPSKGRDISTYSLEDFREISLKYNLKGVYSEKSKYRKVFREWLTSSGRVYIITR